MHDKLINSRMSHEGLLWNVFINEHKHSSSDLVDTLRVMCCAASSDFEDVMVAGPQLFTVLCFQVESHFRPVIMIDVEHKNAGLWRICHRALRQADLIHWERLFTGSQLRPNLYEQEGASCGHSRVQNTDIIHQPSSKKQCFGSSGLYACLCKIK